MIGAFESMVRQCPQRTCFTYVDAVGAEEAYSYRETRMLSAALARILQMRGARPGDCVVLDLPNCPAYVFFMLAAAYGGFTLVALNNRLTDSEKLSRVMEIERKPGIHVALRVDEPAAKRLVEKAMALLTGEGAPGELSRASAHPVRPGFAARVTAGAAEARTTKAVSRASSSRATLKRRTESARQDAVESVIHFAEHAAHVFDRDTLALIMFTSGTTGRAKAVPLTWGNICQASEVSNAALNRHGEGLWQAALPLYHIGGFQVVVRSLLNANPFVLYRCFDAERLLRDAGHKNATHVSVVDKMLQDMLASDQAETMRRYACVLLGGGAMNPQTLDRSRKLGVRVYASYGMTETSSQIAHAQVTPSFQGGLRLLAGYQAHIVDPGEEGFGRLAVKGPGVFEGYLNARAVRTVDGYFLTGDTAALYNGLLYVKERTEDMFVSGGENVYPAEIKEKLLRIPGVADGHVFGVPDARWGRRPVAFVERESLPAANASPAVSLGVATARQRAEAEASLRMTQQTNHQFAATVQASLAPRLSKLYQPKHICVLDEFPRSGIGKVDRAALESLYDQRIDVTRVTLHLIRVPFATPFKTAKGTMTQRESIIVEVTDHAGRTGLGECVAFPTDWYLPETLDQDLRVLREVLAPMVLHNVFLHPGEASDLFQSSSEAAAFPLACGALEPALWDLYGKVVGKPLWQLIGGTNQGEAQGKAAAVPAGAVVGLGSVSETVAAARHCAEAGYGRIKLKVKPGSALACTHAVRVALPDVMLTLDANQSFTERDAEELRGLDACNVSWIEEPLDPQRTPSVGPTDIFNRLARLQRTMSTPLCLDESIARPRDLTQALSHPELKCYAVKIAKFGGVGPALRFIRMAQERGIGVWMGGMYDTGISKRLHAAFETLDAVKAPGDIGATARYFTSDITDPPHTAERGFVTLNREGHGEGLGCDLNRSALANVSFDRIVLE